MEACEKQVDKQILVVYKWVCFTKTGETFSANASMKPIEKKKRRDKMNRTKQFSKIAVVSLFVLCAILIAEGTWKGNLLFAQPSAMTVKYGHNYPIVSPAHKGAEAFKAEVEGRTKGAMVVQIFPAMQLGSNREQLESLQQGGIQVDLQPTAIAGNFLPELQMFDLPYLFPDAKTMWKLLDGDYGKRMLAKLGAKGIIGFGFTWTGFKQITSNRPIRKVEDLNGLKMRVMNSPLLIAQYKGWGANAIPIDFGELYNALQQRVVDGQENPYWSIAFQRYYEVQSNLAESDHAALLAVLMANKAWYDKLSRDQKQIVDSAARKSILMDRAEMTKVEAQSKKTIQDNKVAINVITTAERERFRTASEPAYQYAREKLGGNVLEEFQKALKRIK
jgi:C4-dicarboxylate-binding protein DctP